MNHLIFSRTNNLVLFIVLLSLVSCSKDFFVQTSILNKPLTISATSSLEIRASDLPSNKSSVKRKIEFIDKLSHAILDTFIISMENTDTTKYFIETIKQKTFKGVFKISSDQIIIYEAAVEGGKILPKVTGNSGSNNTIKTNLIPTCKFSLVFGCVNQTIQNMGIFEYGACLYSAPDCYALLWAGCAFNYCITGEQQ